MIGSERGIYDLTFQNARNLKKTNHSEKGNVHWICFNDHYIWENYCLGNDYQLHFKFS